MLTLLLLPALLTAGAASAQALLRCEVTQTVHAACCCPSSEAPALPSLARSSCCSVVASEQALPSASAGTQTPVAPPELAAVQLTWLRFGAPSALALRVQTAPRWAAPTLRTRSGPSLIVLHRRFLI